MHLAIGLFCLTVAVHWTYHFEVFAKLCDGRIAYFFVYYSYSPLSPCRIVVLLINFVS